MKKEQYINSRGSASAPAAKLKFHSPLSGFRLTSIFEKKISIYKGGIQ